MFKNLTINSSRKSTHIFLFTKNFLQNLSKQTDILFFSYLYMGLSTTRKNLKNGVKVCTVRVLYVLLIIVMLAFDRHYDPHTIIHLLYSEL